MPGTINLRTVRKQKKRDSDRQAADESTVRHGESGPARTARRSEVLRLNRHLDNHRLDENKE